MNRDPNQKNGTPQEHDDEYDPWWCVKRDEPNDSDREEASEASPEESSESGSDSEVDDEVSTTTTDGSRDDVLDQGQRMDTMIRNFAAQPDFVDHARPHHNHNEALGSAGDSAHPPKSGCSVESIKLDSTAHSRSHTFAGLEGMSIDLESPSVIRNVFSNYQQDQNPPPVVNREPSVDISPLRPFEGSSFGDLRLDLPIANEVAEDLKELMSLCETTQNPPIFEFMAKRKLSETEAIMRTTGVIQQYHGILGDKAARLVVGKSPRLTVATLVLRQMREWFQEQKAKNADSEENLHKKAMAQYFAVIKCMFGNRFPHDRPQEDTILVWRGSSKSKKRLTASQEKTADCFRHAEDLKKKKKDPDLYTVAPHPDAILEFLQSSDAPKPLTKEVADYARKLDSVIKKRKVKSHDIKTFLAYLKFSESLINLANEGSNLALVGLVKTNLSKSLQQLFEELNKSESRNKVLP